LGLLPPLRQHRRPAVIRSIAQRAVFGRDLYTALSSTRVVLNGAIDMAGPDRGNMRCFEAMGCGALLVSDAGNYPEGMKTGATMQTYDTSDGAPKVIASALEDWPRSAQCARQGREQISMRYSKDRQWQQFVDLVGLI